MIYEQIEGLQQQRQLERQQEEAVGKISSEELLFQAGAGAAIGAAFGGVPGALVGGLFGALSYLGGAAAAKAAHGLGASPETAKVIRRAVEIGLGFVEPTVAISSEARGLLGVGREAIEGIVKKAPESLKLGMKAITLASTTYYIVEPYYEDENGSLAPVGLAALSGLGWLVAHEYPEIGRFIEYAVRATLSEKWPEKVPAVLMSEEMRLGPVRAPKLSLSSTRRTALGTPKLVVHAVDPFKGASGEIREKLGPIMDILSEAAIELKAQGIEPFTGESIRLGRFVSETNPEALEPEQLLERVANLAFNGDREKAKDFLSTVLKVHSAELLKTSIFQELGGTAESYLRMLNENRMAFVHRFGVKIEREAIRGEPRLMQRIEQRAWDIIQSELESGARKRLPEKLPKTYLRKAAREVEEEIRTQIYSDIQQKGLQATLEKWSQELPQVEAFARGRQIAGRGLSEQIGLRAYGTTLPRGKKASAELEKELTAATGFRKKEDIPLGTTVQDKEGRTWHWIKLREDQKPGWYTELPEGPQGEVITFTDIAASVFKTMREDGKTMRKLVFYDWVRNAAEPMGLISDTPKIGFVKLGEELERQGPLVFKKFGTLTDKWVHPDVERALRAFAAMEDYVPKFKTLATLNRIWKYGYLALNLKSYVNAFLGNMVLSFVNDIDPASVLYRGIRAYIGREDERLLALARRLGVLRKEIDIERELIQQMRATEEKLARARTWDWKPSKMKSLLEATEDFVSGKLIRLYSHIDDLFRTGAFLHLVDQGMAAEEAAQLAKHAYGYFEDMPVLVRSLRDTVVPFISFQFRIFPQLLRSFIDHPLRYAAIALFVEGLQRAAFKEMYGDAWDEGIDLEQLVNQEYMKPRPAGLLADFVRVPKMGDLPGGYMYIGFLPWNIPLSIPQLNTEVGGLTGILPLMLVQNPVIRFISGLTFHIDPATGRDVYKMAGPGRPGASAIQYALRTLAPSPGINHWLGQLFAKEGWLDPIISWFNYYGTYPDGQPVGTVHMLWNTIMPSILRYDPDYNTEMALYRLRAVEEEARRQLRKAVRRGAPEAVLTERLEDLERFYEENWQQKMKILESYTKAVGGKE